MMEPYEELANAIILQAVEDYRNALRYLKKHPRTKELEDIVAFRRKQWKKTRAERKAKGQKLGKRKYSIEERQLKRICDSEHDVESIEHFFRSDWYKMLTTVDGEMLIRRLREEVK